MEKREYTGCDLELHAREGGDDGTHEVTGYALLFGTPSAVMGKENGKPVYEVISPSAISRELLDGSDIKLTMFHNRELILARSNRGKGTLGYEIDARGVKFRATLPATADGQKAYELVRRGDISGCSFMFGIKGSGSISRSETADAVTYTINSIAALYDFTLAADPAYPATTVSAREEASGVEASYIVAMRREANTKIFQLPQKPIPQMPKINVRSIISRAQEIDSRINEIADECEREQRERTEAENTEYTELVREKQTLTMRMQAAAVASNATVADYADADRAVREGFAQRHSVIIALRRESELATSDSAVEAGVIEVSQQDMLKPLRAGLIYDKVGIKVAAGMPMGAPIRWPRHGKINASFVGEGEVATGTKIDFSKLEAKPHRYAAAAPVTKELLEGSEGVVEQVVREEMPAAVADLVNSRLMAVIADAGAKVIGPFVNAEKVTFKASVPTRKELLTMKSKVAASGIKMIAPCWVMTESMKAELEDLKVDAGSGRFVCENDKILGYPVFTTPAIGEGNIGFGDWSYQAAAFYGPLNIIADPFTQSRCNIVDFVLNGHFATATLYQEAFVKGSMA